MKTLIVRAKEFAVEKHGDQKYGSVPYEVHLKAVTDVLFLYDHEVGFQDRIAIGWLHDVIEDTEVTYVEMVTYFGSSIADSVRALSKTGEPNYKYFGTIKLNRNATTVKLADRITNMEESYGMSKFSKYIDEYPEFKAALYNHRDERLWSIADICFNELKKSLGG